MRVLLDTNALVSALATRGLCADVLRLVLSEHELLISGVVIAELTRVLQTKFSVSDAVLKSTLEFLSTYEQQAKQLVPELPPVRDPSDEKILRAAIAAGAEILISGDDDLLVLATSVSQLRIVTPRGFWEILRRGG